MASIKVIKGYQTVTMQRRVSDRVRHHVGKPPGSSSTDFSRRQAERQPQRRSTLYGGRIDAGHPCSRLH